MLAGLGVVETFKGRCRGPEHDGTANELGPYNREVSRVVSNTLALFKGTVVLLVDDDDAEVLHRSEDSGPRPYNDLCVSREYAAPVLPPLVWFEAAVEDGDPLAEACLKPIEELWCERYLRHYHESGPSVFESLDDQLEVHLGFSTSRHTMEEEGRECFVGYVREDR